MTPAIEDPQLLAGRLIGRAYNREGLPEIAAGLLLLAVSGLMLAKAAGALAARTSDIGVAAVVLVFGLGTRPLLNWLRRRYLIESSGYVQFRPMKWRYHAAAALLGGAFVLAIWLLHRAVPLRWLPAIAGLFWGASQAWAGRLIGLPRFVCAGAAIAVAGVLVAWLDPVPKATMAMLIGAGGAISLISGATALARALR